MKRRILTGKIGLLALAAAMTIVSVPGISREAKAAGTTDRLTYAVMAEKAFKTLQPGNSVQEGGYTIGNSADGTVSITKDGETSAAVTVTLPDGASDVQYDEEGRVVVPAGGQITVGSTTVTVPEDGSDVMVGGDGKITIPAEGKIQIGELTVTVPEDGSVTVDGDGNLVTKEIMFTISGSTTTITITAPDSAVITVDKDGNITIPKDGIVKTSHGYELTLPEGGTADPTKVTAKKISLGAATVTMPDDNSFNITEDTIYIPANSTAKVGDWDGIVLKKTWEITTDGVLHGPGVSEMVSGNMIIDGKGAFSISVRVMEDGTTKAVVSKGVEVTIDGKVTTFVNGGMVDKNGKITKNIGGNCFATPDQLRALHLSGYYYARDTSKKIYFGKNNQAWWVAGSQDKDSLTLFAASELAEEMFQENEALSFDSGWKCTYEENGTPDTVYQNHYGGSVARKKLQEIEENGFSEAEKELMEDTTVYTEDTKNNKIYSTTDKLYLGYGKAGNRYFTVGANSPDNLESGLEITKYSLDDDTTYGDSWLRTPSGTSNSVSSLDLGHTGNVESRGTYLAGNLMAAFELNLSKVFFASAVDASSSETPEADALWARNSTMTLRLDGSGKNIGAVQYDEKAGTITAKKGEVDAPVSLVVQMRRNDYQDWYYRVGIDGEKVIEKSEIIQKFKDALDSRYDGDGFDFTDCAIWLETTADDGMTYAILAEDVNGDVTLEPGESIIRAGATIRNGTDGTVTIDRESDGTVDVTIKLPEPGSIYIDEDGRVTVPDGGTVQTEDGPELLLPEGGIVDKDGNVAAGQITVGDTTVTASEGGSVKADKDGNITVPAGGTVQTGDRQEMTLPNGGTVDKDGNVAAGKITAGDTTVTAPAEGEKVTADKDGNITVPAGGTVQTGDGEAVTLPNGGTVDKDGNITEQSFTGSGTVEKPYLIKTERDLKKLAELVNSGEDSKGAYYKIEAEEGITLTESSSPWTPIGTADHPFTGTFDGDGKAIKGLAVSGGDLKDNQGLFGVNAGTIKNLTVEGSVTGKDNVGGIAGTNTENGIIRDCTLNVSVTGQNNVGGIAGQNDGTVTGCTNKGSVTGSGTGAGGITGVNNGTTDANTNSGIVSGEDNVGGIAGANNGTAAGNTNSGSVNGKDNVGGIIGVNNGTTDTNTNSGIVSGEDNVGGTAGANNGTTAGNTNSGSVSGKGNVGGTAGANNGTTAGNTNSGIVSGEDNVGGIVGTNGENGKITYNVNSGNVVADNAGSGSSTIGAVIGKNDNTNLADGIIGNYYQKTDGVNKDLTGIGGTADPVGITSGSSPTPEGNNPGTIPGGDKPGTTPGGDKPGTTPEGDKPGTTPEDILGDLTPEQKEKVNQIAKELNVPVETAKKLQEMAQELGIETDTLLLTDKDIVNKDSEEDVKGSSFSKLQAKAVKAKKNSITIKWNKVKGADGYQIYATKCGKNNKYKLVKTIEKAGTTSFTYKKLKKGTAYKIIVKAYKDIDGKKYTVAASKTVHEVTEGGKKTNAKSVKVNKSKVKLKKGKKFKLKAKIVKVSSGKKLSNHRKLSYESTNKKIATVSKKGVIRGMEKGTCYIYVYAENGIFKKVKVTVK